MQDQQVASSSSQPSDLSNASNQVQVLQPTNVTRDHLLDTIIGDILRGVQTRSRLALFCKHFSFVSSIEPKKIDEALKDVDWVNAMHEELNNFTRNVMKVFLLGHSNISKAYRVWKLSSGTIEEVHDVEFDKTNSFQGEDENLDDVRGT